ncbi:MAG: DUF4345 domain-containing protein [Gordonia amarae]|jgi:hypothetical protein
MNRFIAMGVAFYGGLGAVALARPSAVPAMFGGTADTADAQVEIRAVYGGLPLAFAGLLAASPTAAPAVAAATAGMAIVRAGNWFLDRDKVTAINKLTVAAEVAVAASIAAGIREGRGRGGSPSMPGVLPGHP